MEIGPLELRINRRYFRTRYEGRWFGWMRQRLTRGFDDRELWSLDNTIATFVAPRLAAFRAMTIAYPGHGDADTPEKWDAILARMQRALDLYALGSWEMTGDEYKEADDIRLLGEWFGALWD